MLGFAAHIKASRENLNFNHVLWGVGKEKHSRMCSSPVLANLDKFQMNRRGTFYNDTQ